MFNRKLKARIKELESEIEWHYQNIRRLSESDSRISQSISELDWKIKQIKKPVKSSKTEDSKTFEYPYKYTFSDAKKEKEIPVDVRDKILNDYGKSLRRDFVFSYKDDLSTAEVALNEIQVLKNFSYWKRKNSPNSIVITTDLINEFSKRNLK
jgi:predicted nuclease with TOPRIM domain